MVAHRIPLSVWLLLVQMICLHAFIPRKLSVNNRIRNFRPPGLFAESTSTSSVPRTNLPTKPLIARNTGGLRRLPVVNPPNELVSRARKQAYRIRPDVTLKNTRLRARKHATESITALQQALCIPLRDLVQGYQSEWKRLHPFERVVADLTARAREKKDGLTLQTVLEEIHEGRKMILEASKDWISKAKNAETAREANDYLHEATESLVSLFQQFAAPPVAGILELQRSLRTAPIVALDSPAVVLVGAPNVGKSSIVRSISSATPEVNNYPFTTRGMTLGHVNVAYDRHKDNFSKIDLYDGVNSQQCQVMDSPGLLVRDSEEDRNEMEALTLAALQHLPTAVMYVVDLSGLAGDQCSSVDHQLLLRKQVRQRFPNRPWMDVVSKVDLGLTNGALEEYEAILNGSPYIQLSIHDGQGVDELKQEVVRMLGEVRVVLDAMAVQSADVKSRQV
jgi:nucleolar GTP-binding protein